MGNLLIPSLLLLVQLRIDDAGVVDGFELFLEDSLDLVDLLEGDGGLLEDALPYLVGDDLLDEVVDALVRIFLQASGGRFHGVTHDEYGHLLRGRQRSGVGELGFVDLPVRILVLHRIVEVFRLALPMVRLDELLDLLRQSVFLRDGHAVRHVADDDLGAFLLVVHLGVRVLARLVLCEEGRVGHLADVVVERARPHQHRVGADATGCVGCEVGDLHGVLETARSLLRELPEE